MEFFLIIFVMNIIKLSSHMAQISQHNNYTKHQIHSYDQMSKTIITLESKKAGNNDNSSKKLYCLQNSLIMIIFDTPEKVLSHIEGKEVTRKVCSSSVK